MFRTVSSTMQKLLDVYIYFSEKHKLCFQDQARSVYLFLGRLMVSLAESILNLSRQSTYEFSAYDETVSPRGGSSRQLQVCNARPCRLLDALSGRPGPRVSWTFPLSLSEICRNCSAQLSWKCLKRYCSAQLCWKCLKFDDIVQHSLFHLLLCSIYFSELVYIEDINIYDINSYTMKLFRDEFNNAGLVI